MNCYICNENTDDENHCEYHRYELRPLQEFMAKLTGCSYYTQSNAPFLNIDSDHVYAISGFIAGAKMCLSFKYINNSLRLISIDEPLFNYCHLDNAP